MSEAVCNNNGTDFSENIGPVELYNSLGSIAIALFTSVPVLIVTMGLYTLYFRPKHDHPYKLHILAIQFAPTVHMLLSYPVLLSPATIALASMLQDLLTISILVIFVNFTLHYTGPLTKLETSCPIGTPPLCCLICCPKPRISQTVEKLTLIPFKITPIALVINFLINLYLIYSGLNAKVTINGFFKLENIHNILMIPFFLSMMYSYKVFVTLSCSSPTLTGTNPKLRGALNLSMFVFCKTIAPIVALLVDNSVFPCVPGLPPVRLGAMVTVLIQMFYMTILASVLPRLYDRPWIFSKLTSVNVFEHEEVDEVMKKAEGIESEKMLDKNGSTKDL